jgi:hypothetical protein
VLVLDLMPTAADFDRVVLALRDAETLAADLQRWGIGAREVAGADELGHAAG